MNIRGHVKQITVEAKIIRADGQVEDLGKVSFTHRNLLKTLLWRLGQALKKRQTIHKKKGN